MRDKWVDSYGYFGPDRRRRSEKKLWGNRRSLDEATQLPSLGHLLRRVRVQVMDLSTPDDRRRTLQILAAAINEAERLHYFRCADSLRQADRLLRHAGRTDVQAIDARLVEAVDFAAAQR